MFFFSSAATPVVRRSTMPSFHSTLLLISRVGAETLMPNAECLLWCCVWWNCSATWINAFDGIQPMFRQVPPNDSPSTRMVEMPN
ncbi:hypothetical protein D3C84_1130280 [compost metagenome]